MDAQLAALRTSSTRLSTLVTPLTDDQLTAQSYDTDWSIAQVMSHLGSGAVITKRRIDDVLADQPTPDDFNQSVWDEWNAKSARAQADDGLAADKALVARLDEMTADEVSRFHTSMGPMELDAAAFVGMRLNEHTLHTWDIEVASDPTATVGADAVDLIVDNLGLIARFTAKPTGSAHTIAIATTAPTREFEVVLTSDAATFGPSSGGADTDVELPAEAFVRLVYGRLDPEHTPSVQGDAAALDELRRVFPGV